MPTDHHLDPDENALAEMGYETEDVQYKTLAKSVIGFYIFVAFCGVAGLAIFGFYIGKDSLMNPPENTTPFVSRMPGFPNPLLQTNVTARTDIRDLRRQEHELLEGKPTWVDQSKGVVRIPVEKAVDLYLNRVAPNASKATTMPEGGAPPVGGAPAEETGSTG